MLNLFLSNGYAIDKIEPYAKWITVGLTVAIAIFLAVVYFIKKQKFIKTFKTVGIGFVVYALLTGILLLSLEVAKKYSLGYLEENWVNDAVIKLVFIPLIVTLAVGLISVIALFLLKKFKVKKIKPISVILTCVNLICIAITLISMVIYHNKHISGDGYYTGYGKLNGTVLYVSAGVLVLLIIGGAFLFDKEKSGFDTKGIAFAGICVSLSFVLSYIKLWAMPQGGSVTLVSMLPIMIFAYIYGTKKGVFVGVVYGLLQAIQDPWLIHPAQFILDYPIAFASVGFCGVISKVNWLNNFPQLKFALGGIITAVLRFISHVLSGVFAFGAYAVDQGKNLWVYSVAYNSFVFVDIALVIVAGILVFSSKAFQKTVLQRQTDKTEKYIQ